ncbi:hypothetical protein ACLMJK_001422 [Lecanora helva]
MTVSARNITKMSESANSHSDNKILIQGIFKYRKRFEALRNFTLESGQEEIERMKRRTKEAAEASDLPTSPSRTSRNSSVDSIRSPHTARTPSLSNVPEEGGAFAIGDDEDSDDETRELAPTPSQSSPSGHTSRTASLSSSAGEPLPAQLRGMSEKARGKMPAGQPSFSRQNSTQSLSNHASATLMSPTPGGGFDPTAHWIDSWLPTLPLHTTLTLLSSPTPPRALPPGLIDPTPPRVHLFEWTPLSLGWYESLLWGFIFASEMVVQKGTVGVWNGTAVRLFKVETKGLEGPSLTKPMGAVDAVGSRLVSGVASLGIGSAGRGSNDSGENRRLSNVRDV